MGIRSWDAFFETVVKLQAQSRLYLSRLRLKCTFGVLRAMQARLRGRVEAEGTFKKFCSRRNNTLILQAYFRGYLLSKCSKEALEKRTAILMQSRIRTKIAFDRHRKLRYLTRVM